jgi:hypothetical protein
VALNITNIEEKEMPLKFKIEQIAICPKVPSDALELLKDMGAKDWVKDQVYANGYLHKKDYAVSNIASLQFNYNLIQCKEFEILHYESGTNWMQDPPRTNSVSHLGMHCTEAELKKWFKFFEARNIFPIQEVHTHKHTNPEIAGKRSYHYVIFNTKEILGVDLKFIVRKNRVE